MRTILSIFCGLFLIVAALPARAADPIVGTWTGTVNQAGYGSYAVVLKITAPGGGSSDYPSLNCGGSLSGGGSGGVFNFRETITYGRATKTSTGCIDGNIRVVLQGDRIFWEWTGSWQGKSYYASGKLARSSPAPAAKTCGECGKAMLSAVYYGLQQSQGFRNYVHEARQNYANCTRDIAGGCQNACVRRMLYNSVPSCNPFNDAGYKACVDTIYAGAARSC